MRAGYRTLLAFGFISIVSASASSHLGDEHKEAGEVVPVTAVGEGLPGTPPTAVGVDGAELEPSLDDAASGGCRKEDADSESSEGEESEKSSSDKDTPVVDPSASEDGARVPGVTEADASDDLFFAAELENPEYSGKNGNGELDSFGIENAHYGGHTDDRPNNANNGPELRSRINTDAAPPQEPHTDETIVPRMQKLSLGDTTPAPQKRRPLGVTRECVTVMVGSCVVGPLIVMLIIAYLDRMLKEA